VAQTFWLSLVATAVFEIVLEVIIQAIKRRQDNWIGHIVPRNGLLKHVTEGKMKV
jgi:hypothetical protein